MTSHPVPSSFTFMMLYWKGKAKKRELSPLAHILFCSEHNPAVLTQGSHNFPRELLMKESRNESYASFSQWLCSQIVHWAYHKESSGPCGYTSNQGSMPSSTAGCISLGNTTMAAPWMGRAKVSHFHGKSHILTSEIPNSHSTCCKAGAALEGVKGGEGSFLPDWRSQCCYRLSLTAGFLPVKWCQKVTGQLYNKLWEQDQGTLQTRFAAWESKYANMAPVTARPFWYGWNPGCQYNVRWLRTLENIQAGFSQAM